MTVLKPLVVAAAIVAGIFAFSGDYFGVGQILAMGRIPPSCADDQRYCQKDHRGHVPNNRSGHGDGSANGAGNGGNGGGGGNGSGGGGGNGSSNGSGNGSGGGNGGGNG